MKFLEILFGKVLDLFFKKSSNPDNSSVSINNESGTVQTGDIANTNNSNNTTINQTFNIGRNQNQEQFKPWEQCSNEELIKGLELHKGLLEEEKNNRYRPAYPFFMTAIILMVLTIIGSFFKQYLHPLVLGFSSLGTMGMIFAGGKIIEVKSEFEIRQEETIKLITFLLRERGVK